MNKTFNTLASIGIIAALVVGIGAYNKTPAKMLGAQGPKGEMGPAGRDGRDGENGKDGVTKVVTQVVEKPVQTEKFGSVSTADNIDNPYVSIGGAKFYYYNRAMTATSSVPCSILNPFNATSTVLTYSASVITNGFGAITVDVSTSSTQYATSSPSFLRGASFTSGTSAISWQPNGTTTNSSLIGMSATSLTGKSDVVFGPSEYINLRVATGTPGTFSGGYLVGSCTALIQKL